MLTTLSFDCETVKSNMFDDIAVSLLHVRLWEALLKQTKWFNGFSHLLTPVSPRLFLQGICTRAGANLNVSKAVEELYPMKDLEEVYLFDDNLTMFAQINSNKTVWVKNQSDSPNTAYRNKVTIKQGSLMFHAINQEDNGTTIILEALVNTSSEQTITRLGALSSKTLRIFVCSSSGKYGTIRSLK